MSKKIFPLLLFLIVTLVSCQSNNPSDSPVIVFTTATPIILDQPTPIPPRPEYSPGELVEYIAQPGDTLLVLSRHFNTSVEEILSANPIIPDSATTLPPGFPMDIPIYNRNFWGSSYQILPDSLYVNGPSAIGFNTDAFISQFPGWLNNFSTFINGEVRNAAGVIDLVALNYSISPKILIALLEFQSGGLSRAVQLSEESQYPLGYENPRRQSLYGQLTWAANLLNNGYYGWRGGDLIEFEKANGTIERPDPWQNAATVAFHIFFNELFPETDFLDAISSNGLARTYDQLFGDPWENDDGHIPGSLTQPGFILPFPAGDTWSFTGGPHSSWGDGEPLAALDFASPAEEIGCIPTIEFALAIADGLVVRSETGIVVLDLDGDGDERTGWVVFYLHLATLDRAEEGSFLLMGDPVGHPSCEGGVSTGTHVHLARKYNGEWIQADSTLAFNMEGWIPKNGDVPYGGELIRYNQVVTACVCANRASQITATGKIDSTLP